MEFEKKLQNYAEVLLVTGANFQKGQILHIKVNVKEREFALMVADKAYEMGAADVIIDYDDKELSRKRFMKSSEESLDTYYEFHGYKYDQLLKKDVIYLELESTNFGVYDDLAEDRIERITKSHNKSFKNYYSKVMAFEAIDVIAGVPSKAWACKMFPDLEEDEAYNKLWNLILETNMCHEENPVDLWDKHTDKLREISRKLNDKKYVKFIYDGPGTDIEVGMPDNISGFGGGALLDDKGKKTRNMPTAEVSSCPHKYRINGKVRLTMPLVYQDVYADGVSLKFKDGKIVDYSAEEGYDSLKKLLETDEGAMYLGEIAFVPVDSMIAKTKTLFYDILYDENASCHLALGAAYTSVFEGSKDMTDEELDAIGCNQSDIHVDFMIGSEELSIYGELADGTREPVLINGMWAPAFA